MMRLYPKKISDYTLILDQLNESEAYVCISSESIGEFINVFLRNAFTFWKRSTRREDADYKYGFRNTEDYNKYHRQAIEAIELFINDYSVEIICPTNEDLDYTLKSKENENIDFTDEIIVSSANRNDAGIFTDDSDIIKLDRPIKIYIK